MNTSYSIAILGTGGVASALATHWVKAGHAVQFGSRNPASERAQKAVAASGAPATTWQAACAQAQIVLLAVPWNHVQPTLAGCGDLTGKTLIDCINPLLSDLSGLALPNTTSAAEEIARWAPTAHVVKAFNTVGVKVMLNPRFGDVGATLFYCGDNATAKTHAHDLALCAGFTPASAGPLRVARYLESLAMLYIHLAIHERWGSNMAFQVLKR